MTKRKENMHGSVNKNAAGLGANTYLVTQRQTVSANDRNSQLTGPEAEKDGWMKEDKRRDEAFVSPPETEAVGPTTRCLRADMELQSSPVQPRWHTHFSSLLHTYSAETNPQYHGSKTVRMLSRLKRVCVLTPCPEQMVLSVVPGQVLKLNCWMGRHLWLKQMWSVPQAVQSSTYPRSVSPSISTWAPLSRDSSQRRRWRLGTVGESAATTAYLQSREALWRATEKEVSPPWSSPRRGAGEMLEHSRYPQWTSLKKRRRNQRSHRAKSGEGDRAAEARKGVRTVCYTGPRCPCPSRSCLSPSLQCSTSHNRTCRLPSPLEGPRWETRKIYSFASEPQPWEMHVQTDGDLLSPQMYLHCLSLVLHLPLKQRPCGQMCKSISSFCLF